MYFFEENSLTKHPCTPRKFVAYDILMTVMSEVIESL